MPARRLSILLAGLPLLLAVSPGFGMLDLDAGLALRGGARVDVYLRNALDRRVPVGTLNDEAISFLASVGGPMLVQQSTPRTLGVSIEVPFGAGGPAPRR
ncbi:hypothetical protein BV497_06235 [Fulvimonas soli]|nr:hypothetical protein BV497_06235 [Fulvimonas soli]